jgi:hypothetical protein
MRIILFIMFCSLSLSSFAQSTNFPTVLSGKDNLPSYNLRPDLEVLGIQLGGQVDGRQTILIKVRNNGSKYAVPCSFWAKFTWKPDYKAAPQHFGYSQGVPGIKPHRTTTIAASAPPGLTLSNNVPLFRDAVMLQIVVDFFNQNEESNEQNNRFTQEFGFNN